MYLDELNEQQRKAVEYVDGPELVIAGAGSGKTRVLTYKIVHLLSLGFEPWRLLALTFTNKAAKEMRSRIEALVGSRVASALWMGTFHSVFARILRSHADRIGYRGSFTIYDSADSKSLVKTIIKDMALDDKIYKPSVILSEISNAKNALISVERYASLSDVAEMNRQQRRPLMPEIYRAYRDRCFLSNAMDFDDLLFYMHVLLRDNKDIREHYQEYFRYILVDEYQDTNFAQHVIVKTLSEKNNRLCVVGDDAQSIYSFRGANIRNILRLNEIYPELGIFKLERNYRSTQNIINAANSLIEKNVEQIPKKVFSENDPGERVEVVKSYSDFEEGYIVANKVTQIKFSDHDSYEDFAILYRTNAQSRVLEEALRKRNIPYRIYGGLSFYQRKEVKDAIAYFRLAVNPDDDEALKRIINFPTRGIGETTVGKIMRTAINSSVSAWEVINNLEKYSPGINKTATNKLLAFRNMIAGFIKMDQNGASAEELAVKIISDTRLLSMLVTDRTPESISKQENLSELINGVRDFVSTRTEEGSAETGMRDFLGEVSLATDQDSDNEENAERVTLMTVHAAKGLEFKNVFIVGVEEDLFPSAMAAGSLSEIEEERRLLYVAITRAKKYCMMSYASTRYRNGMTTMTKPSRFIKDIDPDLLNDRTRINSGMPVPEFARRDYEHRYYPQSSASQRPITQETTGLKTVGNAKVRPDSDGFRSLMPDELKTGMKVEHSRFGTGVVVKIDTDNTEARVTVRFENTGDRVLLLKFAKLKVIG